MALTISEATNTHERTIVKSQEDSLVAPGRHQKPSMVQASEPAPALRYSSLRSPLSRPLTGTGPGLPWSAKSIVFWPATVRTLPHSRRDSVERNQPLRPCRTSLFCKKGWVTLLLPSGLRRTSEPSVHPTMSVACRFAQETRQQFQGKSFDAASSQNDCRNR